MIDHLIEMILCFIEDLATLQVACTAIAGLHPSMQERPFTGYKMYRYLFNSVRPILLSRVVSQLKVTRLRHLHRQEVKYIAQYVAAPDTSHITLMIDDADFFRYTLNWIGIIVMTNPRNLSLHTPRDGKNLTLHDVVNFVEILVPEPGYLIEVGGQKDARLTKYVTYYNKTGVLEEVDFGTVECQFNNLSQIGLLFGIFERLTNLTAVSLELTPASRIFTRDAQFEEKLRSHLDLVQRFFRDKCHVKILPPDEKEDSNKAVKLVITKNALVHS
jgi:hypothetical protein